MNREHHRSSAGMAELLTEVSLPTRLAAPDEQIGIDELALAARNHGMPLEALRYDVTPAGLHYLLTHYDIPAADTGTWQVSITGLVDHPLTLSMSDLAAHSSHTVRVTMECAGNGRALLHPRPVSQPWLVEAVGTAEWTGLPLRDLLAEAGVHLGAVEVVATGADHGAERGVEQDYQRALPLAEALRPDVLLAYAMNGQPLLPQHGHPVRLVVPGWYGMAHVKWLRRLHVVDKPFNGFQHRAYRLRQNPDDDGIPLARIAPRALIVPPGFPDFMSRTRITRPGPITLTGRAWSGRGPITRVEVSTDNGLTWQEARVHPIPEHPWAWCAWDLDWDARPGKYVLVARATDREGNSQPTTEPWNQGGFANNLVHRIPVACLPGR
jgi:DMSO/TMAO reductase YedYZ molybdopterin-dependent catalytic subunit